MIGKFKGVKNDIGNLASNVKKEEFLGQLKVEWAKHLNANSDVDKETKKAYTRIKRSGPFLIAFMKVGITEEDIRQTIKEIVEEKKK